MRVGAVLTVVFAVGLFVAGCGGGGTGSSSSGNESSVASSAGGEGTTAGGQESGGQEPNGQESGGQEPSGQEPGGQESGGPPLSKKEFIKQGDAICAKVPLAYSKKVQALEAEAKKKGQKPTTAETNLEAAVPPLYVAAEELEKLTPPKGDEAKAEAIIKALEAAAKGLEAKPESPLTGPKSPYAEFQKLTQAYGLTVCSQL